MDKLEKLSKLKLKQYPNTYFKKYWMSDAQFGKSRRKMIHWQSIIVIHEVWRDDLITRLFYLEEGCRNRTIYHESREITRYVAGEKKKLIKGICSPLGGVQPVTMETYSYYKDDGWRQANFGSFVPRASANGYCQKSFHWIEHNTINDLLPYTNQKYSCASSIYNPNDSYPDRLYEYLNVYGKHPEVEMFVKMGIKHVMKDSNYIRWSKKGLDSLGIDKFGLSVLQAGVSLKFYRDNKDKLKGLTPSEFMAVEHITGSYGTTYIKKYMSKKVAAYCSKIDLRIYDDYLKFAEDWGLDLTRNKYLLPKDLKKAHDELMEKSQALKDKVNAQKFEEQYEKHKKLCFENGSLLIFPVRSQKELRYEGTTLNHCVGGYADRVANGTTEILFIRTKEAPDKPYITLELANKEVHQVRGKNNCSPNDEVISFIKTWSKKNKLRCRY